MAFPAGCYPRSQKPLSVPFVGPLDGLTTGLAGCWSVARQLLSAYLGAAIRVRRSSDNVETDIGFTSLGALDTTALLTFVGTGDGFIHIIYGQDGGVNLVTETTADQMLIVSGGALTVDGDGYPAMSNPSTKWFQTESAVSWRHWFIFHDTGASIGGGSYLFDGRTALADSYIFDDIVFGSNWTGVRKDGASTTLNGAGVFDAQPHLSTFLGVDSTTAGAYFLRYGGYAAANRIGLVREIVTFGAVLSDSQRDAVEAALMP